MDELFGSLPVAMMVGIIVVIGVSQFNRVAGAVLSVVFWTVVAVVGSYGYDQGHRVGLPGIPFPQWVFLAICGLFAALHTAAAWAHIQRNKQRRRISYDD